MSGCGAERKAKCQIGASGFAPVEPVAAPIGIGRIAAKPSFATQEKFAPNVSCLTLVRRRLRLISGPTRPLVRNNDAMEDAMARGKLLHKSVPRAELDHRARDARNRLVQVERLLVPRAMMLGSWLSPFVRLLGSRAGGSRRSDARERGSQTDPRFGWYPNCCASG